MNINIRKMKADYYITYFRRTEYNTEVNTSSKF